MSLVRFENLFFRYHPQDDFSLRIPHLSIDASRRIFLEGPSGCGKTTFLNLLTGLCSPESGHIHVLDTDITQLSRSQSDRFRADHFGIIFQLFNLIHYLSVIDNIILPCTFSPSRTQNALASSSSLVEEAKRLCSELDIADSLLTKPVQQLSIGQQQRVAIARALIGQPDIIIADEPTSALDHDRKAQFMDTLIGQCETYDTTLIFVSHDTDLKSQFDHHIAMTQLNSEASHVAI